MHLILLVLEEDLHVFKSEKQFLLPALRVFLREVLQVLQVGAYGRGAA